MPPIGLVVRGFGLGFGFVAGAGAGFGGSGFITGFAAISGSAGFGLVLLIF